MSNNKGTVLKVIGMRKIMIFQTIAIIRLDKEIIRKPNRETKVMANTTGRVPQGCQIGPVVISP